MVIAIYKRKDLKKHLLQVLLLCIASEQGYYIIE